MTCDTFNRDLEMMNAGCCNPEEPLTTQFLLPSSAPDNTFCPRFYGKVEDQQKVYHALKEEMQIDVKVRWGELKCHCSLTPKLRLSKTARNLNKVFLTCGTPATAETRCKYFQWIHTAVFVDKTPLHKLKYSTNPTQTKETQTEWSKETPA